MPDAYGAGEDSAVPEREIIAPDTRRISRIEEEVLGAASVGEEVFLRDGGDGNARDDKRVYRASI
ncbi:hypothetical protein AGMMS5026_11010 [Endomicrobiia bacterium]|nr:hypothetical protein AGMMS5026_11010 [Endomicrobiia bacterium]